MDKRKRAMEINGQAGGKCKVRRNFISSNEQAIIK
jgi:hypothetical protein